MAADYSAFNPIALAVACVSIWLMLTCQRAIPNSVAIFNDSPVKPILRLTARFSQHFDVGPRNPAAPSGAQHFQHRFLGAQIGRLNVRNTAFDSVRNTPAQPGVKQRSRKCSLCSSTSRLIRAVSTMSMPCPRIGILARVYGRQFE